VTSASQGLKYPGHDTAFIDASETGEKQRELGRSIGKNVAGPMSGRLEWDNA
jgi:hypothetical protein